MDSFALKTAIVPDSSPMFTLTLVIAGFLGVLLLLTVLIIVFSTFSKTISKTQTKKGKKKVEKAVMTEDLKVVSPFANAASAHVPQASVSGAEQGISEEVVAAISAAVYMMEGENAVVSGIAPVAAKPMRRNPINTRNPWAMAAIAQNTKPF